VTAPKEAAAAAPAATSTPAGGPDNGTNAPAPVTAAGASGPVTSQPVGQTVPVAPQSTPIPSPVTEQVTGQVFPEVTRLVTRGDGTQRITLKLQPEALGEVRVVLTVRDGDVHVRMTGSELAQQALRAGAPELQRLLDLSGASSSQVVVGDQGTALDAGAHHDSGPERHLEDHPQDHRTAGTRYGDTSARDGSDGGPQPRSSTEPTASSGGGTRTRPGVDVTI
jgi:flagellar hook-length control protein FliK